MKLTDVFQSKFPLIPSNLFEFVKCCRRTISAPTVSNDFKWDFWSYQKFCRARETLCAAYCTNPCCNGKC